MLEKEKPVLPTPVDIKDHGGAANSFAKPFDFKSALDM
jgi:hypothetical protein